MPSKKEIKKELEEGEKEILINKIEEEITKLFTYIRQLEQEVELSKFVHECDLDRIHQLEQENINLKMVLDNGLNKNKKYCFYKDGNTGKCLGYSNVNDDEPCEYCKTCEALSIKGDD